MEQPESPIVEQPSQKPQNKLSWKKWLVISSAVAGGFVLLNLAIWGMYQGRAYPGVTIGGQDVSNLDQAAITNRLNIYTADYKLEVTVKGQPQQVSSADLGLQFTQADSATAAINEGKNNWLPLYGLIYTWKNGATPLKYTVDEAKLKGTVTKLAGESSVAATDAKVVITGETVAVEADKPGQGVDQAALSSLIRSSIAKGSRQAQIGEGVTRAAVTTDQAAEMATAVRKTLAAPVSIQVNGKTFTPGAVEIGKWLVVAPVDGKLALSTNADAVNAYIAGIASQVDVRAVNKQINMVNGVVRTVSEGKAGSALDRVALAAALTKAVTTGTDTAVTGTMAPVAFKNITNSTVDLEGKYIEINLSRQHLWAYDNKQLVYESPITSGATGAGFATVQGLFSIKAKQTNRNLNGYAIGYDYNVFVNYWMPFSGNYGMHDASWRTSFGGSDYYYGGSHGCVNLPTATAAWVYNFVLVGTPVWVHS